MEIAGIRLLVAPETTITAISFILGGITLGTVSGLTPGLHANNFALLLAAIAPSVEGPPIFVGAAMLAAGVVHTFLDIVPAVSLGVPDAAMAATALPGHQLVIEGRGREALRLSALGSGLAVLLAIPLAVPITAVMTRIYPVVRPHFPVVLVGLVVFLIATERTRRSQLGGAIAFFASAGLGIVTLDLSPQPLLDAGGILAPLFAGLFGAPVLLDAIGGVGPPPQADPLTTVSPRDVVITGTAGTIAGAAVGYLPGVSSAIAAVVALAALPAMGGARGFIVATSGINTANTIFALFALVALGTPRTGVLVALNRASIPLNLPVLLVAIAFAAAVGFALVPVLGDRYFRVVGGIEYTRLSLGILIGLVAISYTFAGLIGIVAFTASAAIGLVPPRVGARRVHCMGVLLGPLILG